MARSDEMIVKPEFKQAYFKNARAEKASYLDISEYRLKIYPSRKISGEVVYSLTELKSCWIRNGFPV